MFYGINFLSLILAVVVSIVLGFLWYGPFFGKSWIKLSGISKAKMDKDKKNGMGLAYLIMTLSSFVIVCVLDYIFSLLLVSTLLHALEISSLIWLGFVATTMTGKVLWEGKSWTLYLIDSLYYLVSFLLIGLVILYI